MAGEGTEGKKKKGRKREGGKYGYHRRHTREEGSTETIPTLMIPKGEPFDDT